MRRITQGLVLLLVLGLSVGLVSCGGDDDDADDVAGTYVGDIFDNSAGQGTLTVILAQNGNNIVGSYTTVFPSGTGRGAVFGNGDLTGVINGSTLSLTAIPRTSSCVFVVNASTDDDDLDGTYASSTAGCLAEAGRIDISR